MAISGKRPRAHDPRPLAREIEAKARAFLADGRAAVEMPEGWARFWWCWYADCGARGCPLPGVGMLQALNQHQAVQHGGVDRRPLESQLISAALAEQHERMSADIHEWAKGDDELGWPGDDILKDRGNCDDLAAFLQERGWNKVASS